MSEREPRGTFDALPWIRDLEFPSEARTAKGAALKSVLYAIASRVGHDNACHPSQARLARDAGMGERTVRRHLEELEAMGLIVRRARSRGEGRGRSSDLIVLVIGAVPAIDQPANLAGETSDQPANLATRTIDLPANEDRPTGQNVHDQPATGGRGTARELSKNHHDEARATSEPDPPDPDPRRRGREGSPHHTAGRALSEATRTLTDRGGPYAGGIRRRLAADYLEELVRRAEAGHTVDMLVCWVLDQEQPGRNPDPPPAVFGGRDRRSDCPACHGTEWVLDDDGNAQPCTHGAFQEAIA